MAPCTAVLSGNEIIAFEKRSRFQRFASYTTLSKIRRLLPLQKLSLRHKNQE
jgi:hypothetical protein